MSNALINKFPQSANLPFAYFCQDLSFLEKTKPSHHCWILHSTDINWDPIILDTHLWTGAIAIKKTDQMPCPLEFTFKLDGDRQLTNMFVCSAGGPGDLRKKSPDTQVLSSPEVICRQEAVWVFQHFSLVTTYRVVGLHPGHQPHAGKRGWEVLHLKPLAPAWIVCQAVFLSSSQIQWWAWDVINCCRIIGLKRHRKPQLETSAFRSDRILAVTEAEAWSLAFQPNQVG